MSSFRIVTSCPHTQARAAELPTPHGAVPTPAFLPVGSQATVKTLDPGELQALGVRIVLANTYHLYLRPGAETIGKIGGLHRFMAWEGPILTDSGGYQVFSLAPLRRVSDEGVLFRSHIDGSEHFFTPELAVELQEGL
ncbi:MAG: tRNA-guanine transglycosylase, partial [Dehalococcoidia bacterium]